ncbi:MAG: hypothetical protein LC687_00380 [Actinobacteria bacterium]|nr:hypothetical protein [Actinomycetota bacterium]MCA1806326.1 hypothetical protein [Actinomycetota bacterium]
MKKRLEPKYITELVREVWDVWAGTHVEIGPDREGLDMVEIRTYAPDEVTIIESMKLEPGLAARVGNIITQCAEEMIDKKKEEE